MIFDIKRYAIHDGPGIRTTVFFKGCPLSCPWCHNPEGIEEGQEIWIYASRCAGDCRACLSVCNQGALSKDEKSVEVNRSLCNFCRKCEEACMYEAIRVVGEEITVAGLMAEIEKDKIFFEESGGGLTLSGGEPLVQLDFVEAFCQQARKRRIPVTLDTSGSVPFSDIERISQRVDHFLYDMKMMDPKKHKEWTGVSNEIILENLSKLSKTGKSITVRIPLIAGLNDDEKNISEIALFLQSLESIQRVNLLPFHKGGEEKRKKLGKKSYSPHFSSPAPERLEAIKKTLSVHGFLVIMGG